MRLSILHACGQRLFTATPNLDQVINSGTIDNMQRYQQVISYVQGGQFNASLQRYDNS